MIARGGGARPPWRLFVMAAAVVSGCSSARPAAPRSPVRPTADPTPGPAVLTAPAASPDLPFEFPSTAPIRVGIRVSVRRASIGAPSGVLVATPGGSRTIELPRATFVAGPAGRAPGWEIQVGSVTSEDAARELASRAASVVAPARVTWNAASSTYRVRVGAFASRELALDAAASLGSEGLAGWVVEVEDDPAPAASLRLLEAKGQVPSARIWPARAGELLSVDADRYRGTLEVLPGRDGLQVVNVLPLEEYLRGVVPKELPPESFGELEALKAQAVAARTYATRNRGRFRDRGYDICATPACQVYGGREAEHPLSDRAVAETIGLVAFHEGRPINALYTSTCGGSTEDGVNLFPADPAPYLKGVACAWEAAGWGVVNSSQQSELTERGPSLLEAVGVLAPAAPIEGEATHPELVSWTEALLRALGLGSGCASDPPFSFSRASFFRYVVVRLCWSERAERMVSAEDYRYLLPPGDRNGWTSVDERHAAVWLVQQGLIRPGVGDTLSPASRVLRADAVALYAGVIDRLAPRSIEVASFVSLTDGVLSLSARSDDGDAVERVDLEAPLAAGVRLFRTTGAESLATRELRLTPGEELRLIRDEEGAAVHLEAFQSRLGPSTDRDSRYHQWIVSRTPEQLAASLKRYGNVGRVLEIVPTRIGVSGRVLAATVEGTSGRLGLNGLEVRWGLGLRENLFAIDRIVGEEGRIERFVFTGKGWGHGVGMCQVGAYGLAKGGATFDQILHHYYTGITIERIDDLVGHRDTETQRNGER